MNYTGSHLGELSALAVAFFWTITALAFESASKKIGSLQVNIIRLFMGFIILGIFGLFYNGHFLPADASAENWIWLALSGLVGFVFGDYCLFKSYTIIGSKIAMLIMTVVPLFTTIFGWFLLGDKLRIIEFIGMFVVISGIGLAIFSMPVKGEKISLKVAPRGILYALGGALGQAVGLVLSKYGMNDYDPFSSTQIRVIAGIAGFSVLVSFLSKWGSVVHSMSNIPAMKTLVLGAFFGPFLGVSFSLLSVKYTDTGIASTIMAIVPVLIIAPSVWIYGQKTSWKEITGAIISVTGVAILFL